MVVAVGLTLMVTACGSTSSVPLATPRAVMHTPTTTVPPTLTATAADALRAAVQAYSDAYLGGQGTAAFAMISPRCQQMIGSNELKSAANEAKSLYGVLPLTSFTVNSNSGTSATVTYTYAVATLNQSNQPWTLVGGQWKYDHC